MPVYSVAQMLPLLITERIVAYVLMTAPSKHEITGWATRPQKQRELRTFLSVSRSWRQAAALLFYRSAVAKLDNLSGSLFDQKNFVNIDDIVETETQPYLRELYIHMYLPNFCQEWEDKDNLGAMLKKWGKLPSVRSLVLFLTFASNRYKDFTDAQADCAQDIVESNLQTFACWIKEQMPHLRKVSVNYDNSRYLPGRLPQVDYIISNIGRFFGPDITHASLDYIDIGKSLMNDISATALRSITIAHHKGTQKHVELVRRYSASLENLRVSHITVHSVLKMTWGKKGGYHTLVYPRLKHLHMTFCTGRRDPNARQPLADPFPALQTLICHGNFPFSTPILLSGGRAHIRHLDIDLDGGIVEMCKPENVFSKWFFQNLTFASLGSTDRATLPNRVDPMDLFTMTANLCATTSTMRMRCRTLNPLEGMLSKLSVAKHLQVLEMQHSFIRIDQALELFGASPCLMKASIALSRVPEWLSAKMPPAELIQEYQQRYKSHTSTIQSLNIRRANFQNSRNAAEFIVLLADILPSIKRVSLNISSELCSSDKVIRAVEFARKRPMYRNHAVANDVEFEQTSYW
ncbi:hypothetical protein GGF46_001796 [Coemansia sp. RSA 552]|nr:hypothetical protein GGF46_001796 [Coemansia sp. RSA 552]